MIDNDTANKLKKFKTLALAVSGGKDSMFLLNWFVDNRSELPYFFVINVDHNLRGEESKADSEFVRKFCADRNVECKCFDENVREYCQKGGYGLEQGARLRRREIFAEIVATTAAERVVTAHHKDDQCESVLMHIFRGCGINGLKGMLFDDGMIVRPLLNVGGKEIEDEMKRRGLEYRIDSTNACNDYRRNKLRNEIIPMIKQVYPGFVDNVVRLSQLAVSTADFVDKFVVKAQIKNGEMLLTDELLTCEETILTASLFDGLERMGRRVNIERKHIEAIKSLTNKPPGSMVCLPDNLAAYRDRNGIVVAPGRKSGFEKTKVDYGVFELGVWKVEIVKENCLGALRADMDILGRGMLRQREKGDRICKFGGGSKSLGDYLTDKKVPLRERDDLVIIAEGNDVLAVLPVDISSKVAVTQTTKNVAYIKTTKITGEK